MPPPVVAEALAVLGQRVRLGRQERGWSAAELAVRAGVTAPTVRAAEAGRPGTASGTLFTLAWLVGVPLFEIDDPVELARLRRTGERELALLPARVVHRQDVEPDADF
ncbi:transcriptional regulator with XRE-family HTH domain [Amnibacterium kyonggiense]|uniref:Transcriptional regulator with XRE-family HTH domain n=1 Tax=Amnibacterium kyonggiense TaxID=595671 RepID=A0A4R7FH54_9MICO|nr:transcriptional regulator with XRE-family HTH domain [Amnibacterium kyonggiense]